MKKLKYIALSLLFAFGACEDIDFGDTNENPNGAGDPNTSSLMAGAMSRYSTLTGRDYIIKPTLYVQYQSQVTYTDESRYSEAASTWYSYYVQTLSNLQLVVDICSDEANFNTVLLSQGAPVNQIAVSKIFQAVVFKRITDTWGDAPYSQALKSSEFLTPAYDSQQTIYEGLIAELKNSRDMLNPSLLGPTGDIIYGGDVTKWKKFANSMIMQMALQLSKKFPSASGYAANEFNAALNNSAGVIDELGEEAWFTYNNDFSNPWNANRKPDYFLSKEFTDALQGVGTTSNTTYDARLEALSTNAALSGVPYGYENESGAGRSQMSDNIWTNEAPLPLLTASYTYLNRADAANLGWTSENVATMLSNGIEMSYATLDANYGSSTSGSAAAYAAARVADLGTVGATQVIAEEKWVALFPSGFDAWAEWRRTEYPVLYPATDYLNNGNIPRRYVYPTEESTLNASAYSSGLSSLSPATDNNTSKVWWDQ